ncbi:sugar phosphate isomerase/epimerase family protein [Marinoscillum sp.]|uniref:sugar phosphate isomerase/epimerase family protein n=1 Tax=Marinoscillum sp. TaxID=2024838 RepID=UPI003BAD7211
MNKSQFFAKAGLVALYFLCLNACVKQLPTNKSSKWPISSYNFGGMQEMSVAEQVSLLRLSGYDGLILRVATPANFEMLPDFIAEVDKYDDFQIHAAFVRYNFEDTVMREQWKEVVDQIASRHIQLWVIFGKEVEGYDEVFIENKLREINDYALVRGVEVILYPHSSTYYESVEEALPMVKRVSSSNLHTAVHLYHEIRAGNGHRMHEVLEYSISKLGAVTLAGTDSVADYTSPLARDTSTIKTIGCGSFDLKTFLATLHQLKYDGFVGVMNFKISADPKVYLPESKNKLDDYMEEIQSKL